MMFYDHFVQGDWKQDFIAVDFLLEAGFIGIKRDLPSANELILLTYNAGCYRNSIVPIMVPFLAKENGMSLIKFIHIETQDGKSLVDAHFAIAMRHVSIYVNKCHVLVLELIHLADVRPRGRLILCLHKNQFANQIFPFRYYCRRSTIAETRHSSRTFFLRI